MLDERLEHVDAGNEQVVALVLIAIAGLERLKRPLHPLAASLCLLSDDAQLAVEKAHAAAHGQFVARHCVIA